jgi:hypothetical protein
MEGAIEWNQATQNGFKFDCFDSLKKRVDRSRRFVRGIGIHSLVYSYFTEIDVPFSDVLQCSPSFDTTVYLCSTMIRP